MAYGIGLMLFTVADHPDAAATAADILKAIAHPLRLRIVAILSEGDAHVGALAERLEVKQPIVSQQLRILRMRGLVEAKRDNGLAVYHLAEPHLRNLLSCVHGCLSPNGGTGT